MLIPSISCPSFVRNLCCCFTTKKVVTPSERSIIEVQKKHSLQEEEFSNLTKNNSTVRETSYDPLPISVYGPVFQPAPKTLSAAFLAQRPRLLIADDDLACRKMAFHTAKHIGFLAENITVCKNLQEARVALAEAYIHGNRFHVIFSDRDMGNKTDGDTLAKEAKEVDPTLTFILISGTPPESRPEDINQIFVKGAYTPEDIRTYLESTIA